MAHKQQTSTQQTMQNRNVAGGPLALFSKSPPTGFYRDGYCRTGPEDSGNHSVAATVTQGFLDFTTSRGNNLTSSGVTAGQKWCLCASRWQEAMKAAAEGQLEEKDVPKVFLHASDKAALEVVGYKDLKKFAAEPEAGVASGRQEGHHSPETQGGIAKESQEIGSAQPTLAPGAGRWTAKSGEQASTSGSRG